MSSAAAPVTLRIMLAPSDLEEARSVIPHQLRQWGRQVDEILCTLDIPRRPAEVAAHRELSSLIDEQRRTFPHLRLIDTDYSVIMRRRVAEMFYGGRPAPLIDHRDRPVFGYLFGLLQARHDLIFHIDSDLLFGGGSQNWITEARQVLFAQPDILTCSPLPGPPRDDGALLSQVYPPARYPLSSPAYRFPTLSTRLFMLDRRRLASAEHPIGTEWPSPGPSLRVLVTRRRRPHEILERSISRRMASQSLYRVDFLGQGPGMWGVHPLERSARYVRLLPALVRLIEQGDIAESQRGEYNLTEGMLASAELAR